MSTAPLLEAHALTIETPGRADARPRAALRPGTRAGGGRRSQRRRQVDAARGAGGGSGRRRGTRRVPGPSSAGPPAPRATSMSTSAAASPGERRRQRLQAALDARPDLLLLDEPTFGSGRRGHRLAGRLALAVARWLAGRLARPRRAARLQPVLRGGRVGLPPRRGDVRPAAGRAGARARGQRAPLPGRAQPSGRREEHNATVRRRRQRKKNVGRIRELKRCPARIQLNDKRSYKQESQGKRAVLQKPRIGAARDGVKALATGACPSSCRWSWRCRVCRRRTLGAGDPLRGA